MRFFLLIQTLFWKETDFWIFFVLAIGSLLASIFAFYEAKKARKAAIEAGKIVKIQTLTIELSEIIQRLDKLDIEIDFSNARNLLTEINRRTQRIIAPFISEESYLDITSSIRNILETAKKNLNLVRPMTDEEVRINSVYYAIESDFSELSGKLAQFMGLLEERTISK